MIFGENLSLVVEALGSAILIIIFRIKWTKNV